MVKLLLGANRRIGGYYTALQQGLQAGTPEGTDLIGTRGQTRIRGSADGSGEDKRQGRRAGAARIFDL